MSVVTYNKRDMGIASRWVREALVCPNPELREGEFISFLVGLADRYPDAVLMPSSDRALQAVVRHAATLEAAGFAVAAPSESVAKACLDKSATYAVADAAGVPAPVSVNLGEPADIDRFAARAKFPAVLKPMISHQYYAVFGRKWKPVNSVAEAMAGFQEARAAGLEVMLQELITGDELCGANYNAYFWDGQPLLEMTAEKIRNSPMETGSPCVAVSRDLPEVRKVGRELLAAMGYQGFANIEFKRDPVDGLYKVIEVNARHNLSGMLALRCGVNFPLAQYRHVAYGETPAWQDSFRQGLYWIDGTRDVRELLTYLRRGDYSLRRFVAPYLAPHTGAVWDRNDTGPARMRLWDTVRELFLLLRGKAASGAKSPANNLTNSH
ncbi:putative ATP-grasp superfamily ATP-dependent carboligase [Pseudonocardia eucalypti]|uniref:hypothetical protein n=1 Tax=Pseudonocardia eucalypti TaxID=648755 RepID=UPI00160ECFA2|nr:putative ATP-grasp superfamily ATP-dependent carboligase [Pseudonocardia eucalypti]